MPYLVFSLFATAVGYIITKNEFKSTTSSTNIVHNYKTNTSLTIKDNHPYYIGPAHLSQTELKNLFHS